MDVIITVDTELWLDPWSHSKSCFKQAYEKYILGKVTQGMYGLPYLTKVMADHGLTASFFVEPLFSLEAGTNFLEEIIYEIQQNNHEVQLHLHTEWLEHLSTPILGSRKGTHMRDFSADEQSVLIAKGLELLKQSGALQVNAFRAGNFAFNQDTLTALANNQITFDTSYNHCLLGQSSGMDVDGILTCPIKVGQIYEYPVSIFCDYPGHFRPAQICACSYNEMTQLLLDAYTLGWPVVTLVTHSFELLDHSLTKLDKVVNDRFRRLCRFLEQNDDKFQTVGFLDQKPMDFPSSSGMVYSNLLKTGHRYYQQLLRRLIY